jgi:hypothetical protein
VSGYEFRSLTSVQFTAQQNVAVGAIQVPCQVAGNAPISGGYEIVSGAGLSVLSSLPVRDSVFTGWRVIVRNVFQTGGVPAQVRVHVVCAKVD